MTLLPMLTSPHNPRIQRVRALLEKHKVREEESAFVVEGVRLVEEGLAAGWQPEIVLYTDQLSERGQAVVRGFAAQGAEVYAVPARVMGSITETETPQGLLAVFPQREMPMPQALDFVVIADALRDPGNLGTLLRTAAAAGAQAALLSPSSVDAFAPKVMRAGMGAHFRLPIRHLGWEAIRALCKNRPNPLRIYLAEAAEGAACWDTDLRQPIALVVGSEASGATPQAAALADAPVSIPMPGKSESLNAAIAAGILLFEVVRQRRRK